MRRSRLHMIGYQCLSLTAALLASFILTACDPKGTIKPATLDELNQDIRYPDPDAPGLFTGEKGHYELVGTTKTPKNASK